MGATGAWTVTVPKGPLQKAERYLLVGALAATTLLPLIDAIGRPIGGFHIPGSAGYVQLLTLWIAFIGGLLATAERKHLTLSTAELISEGNARKAALLLAGAVSAAVAGLLAYASFRVVMADRQEGKALAGGVPQWVFEIIMPLALVLMAFRFAWGASHTTAGRLGAAAAVGAAFAIGLAPSWGPHIAWPLAVVIIAAALLGAPVFVAMGGLAILLFFKDGTPISAVSAEVYRLISSPTLPAIPLLTAAGYVLAEGRASSRLVRFFRALFGWTPGGLAVMVAAVCAMFTTFTGGSGVTIIALGGLVYPMLKQDKYPQGFSLGLVTASGSLGLLFPPSLPVILYSVVASVPADALYIAGLIPGLLLVVLVAAYGIRVGRRQVERGKELPKFSPRELGSAAWAAKWELLLPIFVIVLFMKGWASMVEVSAAACAYAVIVECFVMRDFPLRQVSQPLLKAAALMGSVLLLLSVAMGLTSYLVDAQIPTQMLEFVQTHIHSRVVFLLVLNVLLLVLGSVLEIYSAIVILAPLIAPMGAVFGVHPVHLGVIFLANLELGFLFPPVGLNLFLASSRFGKPLPELYRHVLPFLIILGAGVLLITYVPDMSLGLLKLTGRNL